MDRIEGSYGADRAMRVHVGAFEWGHARARSRAYEAHGCAYEGSIAGEGWLRTWRYEAHGARVRGLARAGSRPWHGAYAGSIVDEVSFDDGRTRLIGRAYEGALARVQGHGVARTRARSWMKVASMMGARGSLAARTRARSRA
jgi:hypothetical protein